MKREMNDASLEAWHNLKDKLGYNQKQVFAAIRMYPNSTNQELAQILDWQINRITGRVNELRKMNLIEDGGKRKDRITGNTAHTWRERPAIILPNPFPETPKVEANPQQIL